MPRAFGSVATAATSEAAVNDSTYNEPSAATALSIKSASVNDAAAGTGVRTVQVRYFLLDASGNITGPFTYTATLNGTTAVAIDATNAIRLIDSITALTVGSGGVAAGDISIYPSADGTGTPICALKTGARRTNLGHAYVPSGSRLNVTDVQVESGEASTVQTQFSLRAITYPIANVADRVLTNALGAQGFAGTRSLGNGSGLPLAIVAGPARVQLYTTPGAVTGTTQRAEFGYYYS